jgi:hypothetical protein
MFREKRTAAASRGCGLAQQPDESATDRTNQEICYKYVPIDNLNERT